jgi:hypothetical protein
VEKNGKIFKLHSHPPFSFSFALFINLKVKLVSYHDASAFMTTRYHMPETIVDKASKYDVSREMSF